MSKGFGEDQLSLSTSGALPKDSWDQFGDTGQAEGAEWWR